MGLVWLAGAELCGRTHRLLRTLRPFGLDMRLMGLVWLAGAELCGRTHRLLRTLRPLGLDMRLVGLVRLMLGLRWKC
ncbi:hypothetical protein HRbin30_03345 [bacterium HR30]|nr:hypothetical protein HRbin30_03345 [bacterium HR30]